MSNIYKAFENGKAFIPFITCGDPDLETTKKIVKVAADNGADLIELGIPFSDPTAEGPVIQEANLRALSNKITTDDIFELVRDLRKEITVPFVFMTYANVVFSYGTDKFLKICLIAKEAKGFLYTVSSLGVTGTRSNITTDLASIIDVVRKNSDIPTAIGFGISTPEQAAKMAALSDGAIVGSAIIKILAQYKKESPKYVGEYVKKMKDAVMSV